MNIKNLESGISYQLSPSTKLKIERTNPFFNDYGEQSVPVSLPDTLLNRQALNLPGWISGRKKPGSMIKATIQDGEYFMPCRQAILSVSPDEEISTSFYMNEGSFYSKLENTYISDVFGDETVLGVSSLDQAISYIKSLNDSGGNEMFSVFQVKLDDDDNGISRFLNGNGRGSNFNNEEDTTEVLDGKTISVTRGFYMTPFLKANYVLKRLFAHFGYTLLDNFFTQTPPFPDMVFINNVADAIVTGTIRIAQLIPKVPCNRILELFRRKFCCEFITDEVNHTASIIMFNDIMSVRATSNLTNSLVGKLHIEFPEKYKQLILEPEESVDTAAETFDSLALIRSKYPTAKFNEKKGYFYREGYKMTFRLTAMITHVSEIVADCGQRYYDGGNLETKTISVPECIPGSGMYIGDVQFLNSSMKITGSNAVENTSDVDVDSSSSNMYLMLAFAHKEADWKFTEGSVTNYICQRIGRNDVELKFGDYALIYNGRFGIFEKFYRKYDTLLRNTLHTVKGKLLLTQYQKISIPSYRKVLIGGSEFLLNKLNYYIGGENEPAESELYTTQLYEPVSLAKDLDSVIPPLESGYVWRVNSSYQLISEKEYNASPFKDAEITPFFPPPPTKEMVGKRMYECRTAGVYIAQNWALYTFWLEAVPDESSVQSVL